MRFAAATLLTVLLGCQPAQKTSKPADGAAATPVKAAPTPVEPPGWVTVGVSDAVRSASWSADRLALSLTTMGITPKPLAVTGVRSVKPVSGSIDLAFTLDWNRQANGAYLKVAVYLSPHRTDGDPAQLDDWVRVSYIGVPPGDRWRHELAERRGKRLAFLDRAGWPHDRRGRVPGVAKVHIRWTGGRLELLEGGATLSKVTARGWSEHYVYVTLTSHSNYPQRTVYVDGLRLRR